MAASSRKCPKAFGCYVRGKLLGSGAFANVYACRKSDDEEAIFAVKAVDLQAMRLSGRGERELKKLQREANILKNVRSHVNVVGFVDLVEHEDWYLFILEFVPGGNLLQSITKRQGSDSLKEHEVLDIFRQLVEGIQHLHGEAVIHRDLKLENVLVAQEGNSRKPFQVKITDFGLSKEVGDGMSAACSVVGSPKYVAPEVLASGTHDFKADLWSLGVLLFVLLSNRFPFNGNSQAAKETQDSISAELLKVAVSDAARSVLSKLLRLQAEERISLEDLANHEWLTSVGSPPPKAKRRKLPPNGQDAVATSGSSATGSTAKAGVQRQASDPGSTASPRGIPEAKEPPPQPLIVEVLASPSVPCETGASEASAPSAGAGALAESASAMAIAAAATPRHPALPKNHRRRSWVDCSPEENEEKFLAQQKSLQTLIGRGFEATMAEVALTAADGNLDTAIMMLEG